MPPPDPTDLIIDVTVGDLPMTVTQIHMDDWLEPPLVRVHAAHKAEKQASIAPEFKVRAVIGPNGVLDATVVDPPTHPQLIHLYPGAVLEAIFHLTFHNEV